VAAEPEILEVEGREIRVTNPDKVFFPRPGITKLDVVQYFAAVGGGALTGARDRPTTLHRFPDGVRGESFYQKRVPRHRPEWIRTVTIRFPSGRSAEELVVADVAHLLWMANLGCLEINPWPVRADDTDRPDELRIDLDPTPRVPFASVRKVALAVREVLAEHGLVGFPKTSGKRGIHVLCRIDRRWGFADVRRAALAVAREVERRTPLATSAWWKEERRGVFVDYNQNARDRTVASAYSIRPVPDARVSCPLDWDEVADVHPAELTVVTVPGRLAEHGDPHREIDGHVGSLDSLLAMLSRQEREGVPDAPWPVHHPKMPGEPTRVSPSRARKSKP
jgi:bifunctional non-homologous end joining protein LigD